jgi:LPPG:FO 2-phospho-L-lactate transferase
MSATPLDSLVVLCGGIGGARFLQGLKYAAGSGTIPGITVETEITAIVNTADDLWMHGLKVCPDLDTVMYTLGDGIDPERGWGRRAETWSIAAELAAYGIDGTWFGLGDRDIATHLVRTQMLEAGFGLSEVTAALCRRWSPGIRLLPMSDDRVETHIAIADPEAASGQRAVHFQEYWVRLKAEVAALAVVMVGLPEATPGPGVLAAIAEADLIIVPPSNPVVSVGPILGVPGIRDALAAARAPVVGISPIIAGNHVRGMARQLLTSIGVEVSALGVGHHYGSRSAGGVLDGWLIDSQDADALDALTAIGLSAQAVPLLMSSDPATAEIARAAVDLVR